MGYKWFFSLIDIFSTGEVENSTIGVADGWKSPLILAG